MKSGEGHTIYFLGIGGIGMSALARYYHSQGYIVAGYDRTPSPLTKQLENEGMAIHYEDNPNQLPALIDFVVYTPAVPHDLNEFEALRRRKLPIMKRSEALGKVSEGHFTIAVAGTHGKTTTTAMVAHILNHCGINTTAFIGGIANNFNSNLLLCKNDKHVIVVEADEFDRSFLQLHPHIAVITATDADHLDIYNDHAHVVEAFGLFAAQVDADGAVIVKKGVEVPLENVKARVLHDAYDTPCDFYASDITPLPGGYFDFTINHPAGRIPHCRVGIPGWVNVENAVAASAIALLHGTAPEQVREALASFQGVKRRFDIRLNTPGIAYVDDYAHHPNELRASISSMRNIFPGRKICGIFQPHLYTRTRDFADDFADALSGLDSLILLPIYPAREEPIPGVTSQIIFDRVTIADKVLIEKEALMDVLQARKLDCLVTFGAGNIDRFIEPIEQMLRSRE